ncbi:MAG: AI-2E family transporter [Anaerolineales bacterium]
MTTTQQNDHVHTYQHGGVNVTDGGAGRQHGETGTFRYKLVLTLVGVAILAALLWLLVNVVNVLPLIFISILIAVLLRSLTQTIVRYVNLPERLVVIVVALVLIVLPLGFFMLTGAQIGEQFDELAGRIPESLETVENELGRFGWNVNLEDSFERVSDTASNGDIFRQLSGFFSGAFGALTNLTLIVVAGIYMAFEPKIYVNNLVRLFPLRHRERAFEVLDEGYEIVRQWLFARLISMFVVGLLTYIGLMIIGMPLALTLAIIAGLVSFIPNIGPILGTIPAVLVGFTQSLTLALLAVVVYTIVQMIENYLVTPNVQRSTVALPPALVMLTQIFLALMFGWVGLLVAAPLVAFSIVLVKSVYVEDTLGDDVGPVLG